MTLQSYAVNTSPRSSRCTHTLRTRRSWPHEAPVFMLWAGTNVLPVARFQLYITYYRELLHQVSVNQINIRLIQPLLGILSTVVSERGA